MEKPSVHFYRVDTGFLKGGKQGMTDRCPRCETVMILQKTASVSSRQSLLYCQKCQTTIFLHSEKDQDQPLSQDNVSHKPKILLVDDDTDLLKIMDLQFKKAGFDTVLASSGEEAYTKLVKTTPDLVVADIFLPKMDGWELSTKIRNSVELGYIPIILITGLYTGQEFKAKALEHGVNAFVTKPYNEEALLHTANRLMEQFSGTKLEPTASTS
jgi:CheY-like chemotaxis protein